MIGFIGTGHMGGALARGVLAAGADPASVVVSAKDAQVARDFAEETGARPPPRIPSWSRPWVTESSSSP